MSFSKQSPYAFAIKEMNYWKNRVQGSNRGEPDPWSYDGGARPYRSPSYDGGMDRWQGDRSDLGPSEAPPSLFARRPVGPTTTHLSSSNQINSSLFNNLQSRNNSSRNNDQFTFRSDYYSRPQGGRITRNSLVDSLRAKRILQKRALNAVGSTSLVNSSNIKRKRTRVRKPQIEIKKDVKNESTASDKDKTINKPEKVASDLRLAIIWDNDIKANINGEQAAILTHKLEELLDALPVGEDGHVPRFYASGLSAGIYKIVCTDQKTFDWLKESIENLPELWPGSKFKIIQQSDINVLKHVTIILSNYDADIVTILKRVEKQNPEVKTDKWRVHRETVEENRRIIVFSIDIESLDYLKKNDWKLFLGLRQIKFLEGVGKGLTTQ